MGVELPESSNYPIIISSHSTHYELTKTCQNTPDCNTCTRQNMADTKVLKCSTYNTLKHSWYWSWNAVRTILRQTGSVNNKAHYMVTVLSHHGIWLADTLHRFELINQPDTVMRWSCCHTVTIVIYWKFNLFKNWNFLKQVELSEIWIILVQIIEVLVYSNVDLWINISFTIWMWKGHK